MHLDIRESARYAMISALIVISFIGCQPKEVTDLNKNSIIPKPSAITATGNSFQISIDTKIYFDGEKLASLAAYTAQQIEDQVGLGLEISQQDGVELKNGIIFSLDADDESIGVEGYVLNITENNLDIRANQPAGVFNGIQSLLQLMPVTKSVGEISIPTGEIVDFPKYSYRGAMLDVSRHFFDADEVKRFIDLISAYKINVFHMHLTDDQGWRLEIKSKPELTNIGSKSEVGTGAGGYYTQEQYSDIVKYAQERNITIIPEIDLPGHTNAALASYPELNCDGEAPELYRGTEVGFSTFCTANEYTYEFLDDVIKEIAALTPGEYIHIGGDESHVTEKDDYIFFINRVQDIVMKYGKTMIGWDEIATADLNKSSIVQQWYSEKNAVLAAENGNRVILSPATRTYLDMKYDSTTKIGYDWAALIEVDHGYNWIPDTLNGGITKDVILGIEAPLWTETVETMDHIEYLTFPRLPGYAEIGWTATEGRNWEEYRVRLAAHGKRFEAAGINYYASPKVDWKDKNVGD